jgi:hypothetical protein
MTDIRDLRDALILWGLATLLLVAAGALVTDWGAPLPIRVGMIAMGALGYGAAFVTSILGAVSARAGLRKLRGAVDD